MEKLSKEDVIHVGSLARLKITEEETEKYEKQLNDILTEIGKIVDVELKENKMMISPIDNKDRYVEVKKENHINRKEALSMAHSTNGEFITVSRALND